MYKTECCKKQDSVSNTCHLKVHGVFICGELFV